MTKIDWDDPKRLFNTNPKRLARIKGRQTKRATRPGVCPACGGYWRRGDRVGENYHNVGVTHHYCMGVTQPKHPGPFTT